MSPTTRAWLYGGRNTHAVTPCGCLVGRNDHWLPVDEPVTYPACKRAIAKENTR